MPVRIGYVLLTLSIALLCLWFFYISEKDKFYYRKLFAGILWMVVIVYVVRLFCVCMEEGYIGSTDELKTVERILHYILVKGVYSFYAFFMYSLLNQPQSFCKKKKLIFLSATFLMDILIITSPWTKLIFYVQDGYVYRGVLYWLMIAVRVFYGLFGTFVVYKRRKILPRMFEQSVLLIAVFSAIQFMVFVTTGNESMFYNTLLSNVVVLMLAYTVVDFHKDTLTGMFNQEAFSQYINRNMPRGSSKTAYLIKIKKYDYLRENGKEYLLNEVTREIAVCIREYSNIPLIYYLGSGKFVLMITRNDKFDEQDFFIKLEERLSVPFDINGASIYLNLFVSIMKLKDYKLNSTDFRRYLEACDAIIYRSGDVLEVVNGEQVGVEQLKRYYSVEEAIGRALLENEFSIHYQPIISAKTKKVLSAEALIRLNDRVLGNVSPEEFIPIAESNGTIFEIGDFVIDSVFRFVKEQDIRKLGLEYIELNLSMSQFLDENLPMKLQGYLDKYDLDASLINLEVTETAANLDEELLKKQFYKIKELGFSFSLDDYGTGYSNLVRVLEYPMDIIKLDKSILWSAFGAKDSSIILENLIVMFHCVGRKIVAEGVENEEQMRMLCDLGCDYLQGYFYSRPVCEEDFLRVVTKYNI